METNNDPSGMSLLHICSMSELNVIIDKGQSFKVNYFKSLLVELHQLLHRLGVQLEVENINIYSSDKEQILALNYIVQIFKGYCNRDDALSKIASLLKTDIEHTHILELTQMLLCHDWKERIATTGNRITIND